MSKESPNLDLLRSIAVLAVLADHITATHGLAQKYPFLFSLGLWGVLLFFVHTSFVLMMSLERLQLCGWKLHWTFYVRRIFRIYPLSVATVAAALILHIPHRSWDSSYEYLGRKAILTNILLCQNLTWSRYVIGPMWSLPLEIQMYAVLPVLFLVVRRSRSAKWLAGLWLAAIAFGLWQHWFGASGLGMHLRIDRLSSAEYVPCFLAGVTAYYISLRSREFSLPFWFWPSALAGITGLYCWWSGLASRSAYVNWVCCLLVGLSVVHCRESSLAWLNRLTHLIAKYSYGLYLGQIPVLWLAFVKLNYLPHPVQWAVFLVLIVVVPVACYHLIEKPGIRLGTLLTSPRRKSGRSITVRDPAVLEAQPSSPL